MRVRLKVRPHRQDIEMKSTRQVGIQMTDKRASQPVPFHT